MLEVRDVTGVWTGHDGGQTFIARLTEHRSGVVRGTFQSATASGEVSSLRVAPRRFEMYVVVPNQLAFIGTIDSAANRVAGTMTRLISRETVPFEMTR